MGAIRIAVFISGGGSNLQAILDEIEKGTICGKIEIVISSRQEAYGLTRAKNHGIEGIYIGKGNYPHLEEREDKVLSLLKERNIDLIVLAGYMSILGKRVVEAYPNRILNIHPSLIPSFCGKGFYGEKVHQAVLDYGAKITGATVHFVDEGTDTGPILLQKAVEVEEGDTVMTLAQRVLAVEHELLPKAIQLFAQGRLEIEGRRVKIKR